MVFVGISYLKFKRKAIATRKAAELLAENVSPGMENVKWSPNIRNQIPTM